MSETTEKVYCFDRPSGSDNNDFAMATMLNQNNAWNNNPFVYLVWMMMMRYMNGNGWGTDTQAENYNSRQIAALQDTVNTNHNNDLAMQAIAGNTNAIAELAQTLNTSTSTIQQACCAINASIQQVGGQVGLTGEQVKNAVLLGNQNIIQQLQTCCCENKMLQMQNFSAAQLQSSQNQAATIAAIENNRQAVVNGFSQVGYATQQQTCDIINNQNSNTQKILDALNTHWQSETALALQDEKFKNSQLQQNQYLASLIQSSKCGCNSCGCNS